MDFKVVIPVLISFAVSLALGPVLIPFLRRLKASQTEREDGVKSVSYTHLREKKEEPEKSGSSFLLDFPLHFKEK